MRIPNATSYTTRKTCAPASFRPFKEQASCGGASSFRYARSVGQAAPQPEPFSPGGLLSFLLALGLIIGGIALVCLIGFVLVEYVLPVALFCIFVFILVRACDD